MLAFILLRVPFSITVPSIFLKCSFDLLCDFDYWILLLFLDMIDVFDFVVASWFMPMLRLWLMLFQFMGVLVWRIRFWFFSFLRGGSFACFFLSLDYFFLCVVRFFFFSIFSSFIWMRVAVRNFCGFIQRPNFCPSFIWMGMTVRNFMVLFSNAIIFLLYLLSFELCFL